MQRGVRIVAGLHVKEKAIILLWVGGMCATIDLFHRF
jgi:hypothetical protein